MFQKEFNTELPLFILNELDSMPNLRNRTPPRRRAVHASSLSSPLVYFRIFFIFLPILVRLHFRRVNESL